MSKKLKQQQKSIKQAGNILQFMFSLLFLSLFLSTQAQTDGDCPFCDLRGQSFVGQDLTNANFNGAILDGADFTNATLNGAIFVDASLSKVNFTSAKLDESGNGPANFSSSNLTNAIFTESSLKGAIFSYANISGANFTGADLTNAKPGMELKVSITGSGSIPIYSKAKLSCEFKRFNHILDFSEAMFPECEGFSEEFVDTLFSIEYVETPKDLTKATKVLITTSESAKTHVKDTSKVEQVVPEKQVLNSGDTVFVSTTGVDAADCGGYNNACKSIRQAVTNVNENGLIAVEYGQYVFDSTLVISKSIYIAGGFYNGQPTDYQSEIIAPLDGKPAFVINGSQAKTSFANLMINGTVPSTLNQSSSAVHISDGATLSMKNVNINAAKGGQGAAGPVIDTGSDGGAGTAGSSGTGGAGGTSSSYNNNGGSGGDQATKVSADCDCSFMCFTCTSKSCHYVHSGGYGAPGTTSSYTQGGDGQIGINYLCPQKKRPSSGNNGSNGVAAACGSAGSPSSDITGSFIGLMWQPAVGGLGTKGGDGAGGGGGGSGGPCHFCNCVCGGSGDFYNGTAGGGGGAGGCGAQGGNGGSQGGASFGIINFASICVLDNSVKIVSGAGGNGGNGGSGNSGGKGGSAGAAQPSHDVCNDTGGQGGSGGSGGAGGASGGGAGGNGGPSIGIAQVGACTITGTPVYYLGVSGVVGNGGHGGTPTTGSTCSGATGKNGLAGTVVNKIQY